MRLLSGKFNLSLRGRGEETLFSFPPRRENGTKNSPRMQKAPNMGMTPQMKPTPKMNTTLKITTRSEIKINPKIMTTLKHVSIFIPVVFQGRA